MKEPIQYRTKQLALLDIKLVEYLPNNRVGWTFTDQIVRSSTSLAANYRAVCRVRSDKEFIAKMGIVIEEADETLFWLEIIEESGVIEDLRIENCGLPNKDSIGRKSKTLSQNSEIKNPPSEIKNLKKEANELVSIFVASVKTAKNRLNQKSSISNQKSR